MVNVLMVGVDETSSGGMLSVANLYKTDKSYNSRVNLNYVGTATRKSKIEKVLYYLKALSKIRKIMRLNNVDILHVHMAEKTSVYRKYFVMKIAKKNKCKIVLQIHAGAFMDWYDEQNYIVQKIVRNTLNIPDKILVLGKYWIAPLSRIVPLDKIGVLYNGIVSPDSNPYNSKSKDISFFGHLIKTKGIYEFLTALIEIKDALPPETRVHLCGTDDSHEITKFVSDNSLENLVQMHGWVAGKKKEEILSSTAISILPTYVEGLSVTILEAMAHGIPVITTNVTTMPELLGDIVELIAPKDSFSLGREIIKLISDETNRRVISEKEFLKVRNYFSVEKMISDTLEVYDHLMLDLI